MNPVAPVSLALLNARFPGEAPFEHLEPLTGGNLNEVWRAQGRVRSVIVKRAPPWVASAPSVPLSRRRLLFETRALRFVESKFPPGPVFAPRVLGFCRREWLLLLEDLGVGPDLSAVPLEESLYFELGRFIGLLHRSTAGDERVARRFQNLDVQRTRLASQYRAIEGFARQAGADDAVALGRRAVELGERLLGRGVCLTMGDLWLRAGLVRARGVALIDWEFAHYGSLAQDLGHLAAHLVMHGVAKGLEAEASQALRAFFRGYASEAPMTSPAIEADTAVHFGCEVLARLFGPFRATGPAADLRPTDACWETLTSAALGALRSGRLQNVY